jgi:uncharacterized Zn-binding protein involved in type VI secretion
MADPLVQIGATIMCGHGASASIVPSNTRVTVSGQPVALQTDTTMVAGCPFVVPPNTPMPCVPVQWATGTTRVKIGGVPALLSTSQGMNTAMGPPVPVTIASTQTRVKAT